MAVLPPLITEEGLVLNNMMPDQGALGGYTPLGTASSEGISLMIRGIARAALVTGNEDMKEFANFLFDAACTHFFGSRPSAEAQNDNMWHHSWICNGGAAFNVRGPLQGNGDLALSGYIYGRDAEASVVFTNGIGQLTPPPDIVYQVVSENAAFVWQNVFSDLTSGQAYEVDFYIDKAGNKVFGTQKGGSFGQPIVPAGQHTDGQPGRIVLKDPINTVCGVNYCVTVPDVKVPYGVLYEAWPMWRHLADNEVSTAADAIHWFLDAFALGMEMDPNNADWRNAYDRMYEIWQTTCKQESDNTRIFQAGANGPYNNFPLSYSYGFGRANIDNPLSDWHVTPPSDKYTALRTDDGFVTFAMPLEDAESGSGGSIRYGVAFENSPLYLSYTNTSSFQLDMKSSVSQTVSMAITGTDGLSYVASIPVGPTSVPQVIGVNQFMMYQQTPGDSEGLDSGDWSGTDPNPQPGDWEAVPFPGRRLAMVGDSITWYNTAYVPPKPGTGKFENWGTGCGGYWTWADQMNPARLVLEPGITTDVQGKGHGLNFAIAGTKVANWWLESHDTLNDGVLNMGPMYAAMNNLNRFDVVMMMGGVNDLSDNAKSADVVTVLKKAVSDLASKGKWVFLMAIGPRTRETLDGFPVEQMDIIRNRAIEVNRAMKEWIEDGDVPLPNVWFVDHYDKLLGPNGIDPIGLVSSPTGGKDTVGNFSPLYPDMQALHDGLHPGPLGGYLMGVELDKVLNLAGVPNRQDQTSLGTLTLGPNILSNPSMTFTTYKATSTTPPSFNLSSIGWATGLGIAQKDGAGNHTGYQFGKLPDCWNLWKANNSENQTIGIGTGGTYSNFQNYTWGDMAAEFPKVTEYARDATFAPGAVNVSIITDGGVPALKIDFNIPVTGNKNEAIQVSVSVPRDQHGPWDNWGWDSPDAGAPRPNTVYAAGDILMAESDVKFVDLAGSLVSNNLAIYTFGIVPQLEFGAIRQSFGNHMFFWPPSDMDRIRFPVGNISMKIRAPAITIPPYTPAQTIRYADLKWQFAFDCSKVGVTGSIIIKNPVLRKVIAGAPL